MYTVVKYRELQLEAMNQIIITMQTKQSITDMSLFKFLYFISFSTKSGNEAKIKCS